MPLPVYEIQTAFREAMRGGVAVVTAPPGSGKSTQIPQWLLADAPQGTRIIVLQPRRLAARMLAERVAWELGTATGETVGYITRFERLVRPTTRILFVTEGILTRMLLHPEELDDVHAIVFDEFHERSLHADLGLAMTAQLRRVRRPALRLVVMSATIDATQVSHYLGNAPVLAASGRLHPVEIRYTPHTGRASNLYAAAADAVRTALDEGHPGDILLFLPGAAEIRHCAEEIARRRLPEPLEVVPLYGDLPPEAQRAAMAPAQRRKLILATNIAETSLTIPSVRIVVDSGLVKLNRHEPHRGVDILETLPVSADSAEQRAGRAGREAPGLCIRLWSALEQDHKYPHTPPEIQRLDLADAMLSVHSYGFRDAASFPWFERPPEKAANAAEALLHSLDLITQDGAVTDRGRAIHAFPAHPRIATLLWFAAHDGCYDLAAGCAAILSERPLLGNAATNARLTSLRGAQRRNRPDDAPASDFTAQLALVRDARDAHFAPAFCESLGLQTAAARDILRDWNYFRTLRPRDAAPDAASPETALARALLQAFPDRIARRLDRGSLLCELPGRRRAALSPRSLVRDEPLLLAAEIRENASGTLELSLASGIREDWLWELFPDDLAESDEVFWDGVRQQVLRRRTLACRGLVLEESVRNDPDPDTAARLLADQLRANNMPLLGWDDKCDAWLDKVRFAAAAFPNLHLPDFDDDALAAVRADLCAGETKYAAVRNKPALPFLQARLPHDQLALLNRLCPDSIPLPRGRKLRLEYHPGLPPKGRARIQELYDLQGPVTIGDGAIPVLLDILAPNYRTVQITDDLPRFWTVHYPAIKSQLARRYPKHEWR